MKVQINTSTNGRGIWSSAKRDVRIYKLELNYLDNENGTYGEIHAYFRQRDWNVVRDGLIYTDSKFLRDFRVGLTTYGLSKAAAYDVDYTEQGMQGDEYVSLGVGKKFLGHPVVQGWFGLVTRTSTIIVRKD